MSVDIIGTNRDQCLISRVQCCFTSTDDDDDDEMMLNVLGCRLTY